MEELVHPRRMSINNNFLYVLEFSAKVLKYSLDGYTYSGNFCRKGGASGEFGVTLGGPGGGENFSAC